MTGKAKPASRTTPLKRLVAGALSHLEELGYSRRTLLYYGNSWRKLEQFAEASTKRPTLSKHLVSQFLAYEGIRAPGRTKLRWSQVEVQKAVRVLTEFAEHGSFGRHRKRLPEPGFSEEIEDELWAYEHFCQEHLGHRAVTVGGRRRVIVQFLQFLASRGLFCLSDFQPQDVCDFLASFTQLRPRSLAAVAGAIKSFIRYLCMRGILKQDPSVEWVPIRVAKDQRLPSVWPRKAVEELLAAVDRRTAVGKRDYAILLLSCRFGLRGSDIRKLRIDDIYWSEGRIHMCQSKTGQPLTLPLEDDVAEALIDYLRHGRPQTRHREVFLKVRAPVEPFGSRNSLAVIVTTYIGRAKISLPPDTRRGLHSLRHTLATRLLEAGEPLETIAGILGHTSIESTRTYTSLDLNALRCVSLDPEEVLHG